MEIEIKDRVALLTFDDGKANAVGHAFLDDLNTGLDEALAKAGAVVIRGREGLLSGGFDLKELQKGADAARELVDEGARTFLRLFSHPQPVVVACTGHAIAAGGFLLLTADTRIGAAGDYKLGLTETALGMSFPVFGRELARARLAPAYLTRSFVQSEVFDPEAAVAAGFLDEVVAPDAVAGVAIDRAAALAGLPGEAYGINKRDVRAEQIAAIEASLG